MLKYLFYNIKSQHYFSKFWKHIQTQRTKFCCKLSKFVSHCYLSWLILLSFFPGPVQPDSDSTMEKLPRARATHRAAEHHLVQLFEQFQSKTEQQVREKGCRSHRKSGKVFSSETTGTQIQIDRAFVLLENWQPQACVRLLETMHPTIMSVCLSIVFICRFRSNQIRLW